MSAAAVWVDFHNHVIPGVDDGARDPEEAAAAVAALAAEGVRSIVASPHVDGSLTLRPDALARRLDEIDEGFDRLCGAVAPDEAPVLDRGVELKLDVPQVDVSDPRLRLAGNRAVLVEFPYMMVPPRSPQALLSVRRDGFIPVLAHPERYEGLDRRLELAERWLDAGAYLQINAGSLLGRYGDRAERVAHAILARGWAHAVASDYHARGDPRLAEARNLVESWNQGEAARMLFEVNPAKLIAGEECLPVEPVSAPPSLGTRLKRWLRSG